MRAALVSILLMSSTAIAQPGAPQPEPPPPDPQQPPQIVVDPRTDPAWGLYHQAFEAMADHDKPRAQSLLTQITQQFAQSPAADAARQTGLDLTVRTDGIDLPQEKPIESPTKGALAELSLFQSLHGIALGIELCALANCDEPESFLGLALLGGGAGAAFPFALDGVRSGQRALINSGTVFGAFDAIMTIIITDPDDSETSVALAMAGSIGGAAVGAALDQFRPTAGQVGLASSGGLWAGVLTALTTVAAGFEDNGHGEKFAAAELVAVNAGIAAGAYVASLRPETSRAQTLVMDASGLAGGVAGGAIAVLITGDTADRVGAGLAAIGVAAGLGVSAYLTRDWGDHPSTKQADAPGGAASTITTYVAPVSHGSGATVGVGMQF